MFGPDSDFMIWMLSSVCIAYRSYIRIIKEIKELSGNEHSGRSTQFLYNYDI